MIERTIPLNSEHNAFALALLSAAETAAKITHQHEDELAKKKLRFNIFKALRKDWDEVQISRFLCYLLNPKEDHDCGEIFLNLFLETLISCPPQDRNSDSCSRDVLIAPGDDKWTYVRTEEPTQAGRKIDLYVKGSKHIIAIENKIRAGDQEKQLSDYHAHLSAQGRKFLLLYLTIDGRQSTSDDGCDYFRISYQTHIINWLDRCIEETAIYSRVAECLKQFRDVVRSYSGQTHTELNMQELTDLIRTNPIILEQGVTLQEAIKKVHTEAINDFYNALQTELHTQSGGRIKLDCKFTISGPSALKQHVIIGWQFQAEFPHYDLVLEQEDGPEAEPLCLGFKRREALMDDAEAQRLKSICSFHEFHHPDYVAGDLPNWPVGWLKLSAPFTPDMVTKTFSIEYRAEVVQKLSAEILKYIADVVATLQVLSTQQLT